MFFSMFSIKTNPYHLDITQCIKSSHTHLVSLGLHSNPMTCTAHCFDFNDGITQARDSSCAVTELANDGEVLGEEGARTTPDGPRRTREAERQRVSPSSNSHNYIAKANKQTSVRNQLSARQWGARL